MREDGGTITSQLIRNVKEIRKRFFWDKVTVEEDGRSRGERRNAEIRLSRSQINVWTLPSVRRTFIGVGVRWFQT